MFASRERTLAASLKDPSDEEMAALAALEAATEEADRQDNLREDAQRAKAVVAREAGEIPKLEAELGEAQLRLVGLPGETVFDADLLGSLELEIERIENLDKELQSDRALVAQIDETRDLLSAQAVADVEAQGRLEAASAAIAELGFNQEAHDALERIANEAQIAEQGARDALGVARGRVEGSQARLQSATDSLFYYDSRALLLKEADAKHLAHEHAAARLADFRVAIATTLRPEMEELMSGFVQILTDGRHESVELSEDFDAILYENGVPVEVVSGGTEDIAALAMRLALSQMIAERAGHPLSLLILDEPFGSLDENRRGNVLTLIRRLKGVFAQVVVISHVAETRDAVDHVVEFEFDEGAGRASVVLTTYTEEAA